MQTKRKQETSKPIHYKSFGVTDFKVDQESRTISGYAAIWNNIDDASDMLLKGCCSKSVSERGPESSTNRKIAFLWQHKMSEPIGRITRLVEDEKGLYFEAAIDKIPEGDRVLTQLKSGTLNQFSIGYQYIWNQCEWDSSKGCFIVKEINLFEISVVTMGCNEETSFEGMKSVDVESERNQILRDTEKVLKGLPYDTQIELRQLISKHIALAEYVPTKSHKDTKPQEEGFDFVLLSNAFKNNQ